MHVTISKSVDLDPHGATYRRGADGKGSLIFCCRIYLELQQFCQYSVLSLCTLPGYFPTSIKYVLIASRAKLIPTVPVEAITSEPTSNVSLRFHHLFIINRSRLKCHIFFAYLIGATLLPIREDRCLVPDCNCFRPPCCPARAPRSIQLQTCVDH